MGVQQCNYMERVILKVSVLTIPVMTIALEVASDDRTNHTICHVHIHIHTYSTQTFSFLVISRYNRSPVFRWCSVRYCLLRPTNEERPTYSPSSVSCYPGKHADKARCLHKCSHLHSQEYETSRCIRPCRLCRSPSGPVRC